VIWKTLSFRIACGFALLWVIATASWFYLLALSALQNAAAVVCGYPETNTPSYQTCFSARVANWLPIYWSTYREYWLWVVLPITVIVLAGFIIARRGQSGVDFKL
jgi:hypothetical protein